MTNHVHLLITPHLEQSLGRAMQMLGCYLYNTIIIAISGLAHAGKVATNQLSLILSLIVNLYAIY